ncbi:muconate/chloromuconate family cycloisomerase [Kordiimonas pumila]|uniref:Muconate/chloromuconate family cycloisomerase n=1 Tax=Kordiimonas pumila TaxID=2161677 RepID=A0ABV7D4B3_9PROT|nr:muconate/chloromuconate family cycloisomerase [Kordiimonas pumila]
MSGKGPLANMEHGDLIERVETHILRIPTIRAHKLSVATMQEQRLVIVKITTAGGVVGYGEATTIGGLSYTDESPDSIQLTIDLYFADLIKGCSATRPAEIMAKIRKMAVGNYFAKNAVETALFDILGKLAGLPVSELLGGRVRNTLPVAWTLASGDTAKDIEEGRAMLKARRHNIFKLKIGARAWREDVAHVAAIADAFRGEADIRVDVNQAWDMTTARCAIPALAEAGVTLIEQPMKGTNLDGARELRSISSAAIMADEALRGGVSPALEIIKARAADVLSLKIAQAGGLFSCRDVAQMGLAAGLELYGGTMLEGSVGTTATAQMLVTLPQITWGTELFGPLLLTEDILTKPLTYKDFALVVPDGPGLGVEINDAALGAFTEGKG